MGGDNHPSAIRLAVGGMLALAVAMGIGRFVYTPILPMMLAEIGISTAQAGLIASSNFAGYLIGAGIAATSWLHGSRRRWMLAALFASAITTLLMAWADSYLQFILLRFAGGLFSAWVLVFASALIIEQLFRSGQGNLSAMHFAGVGAGIVMASILTTSSQLAVGSWSSAWLYNGLFALLMTAVVGCLVTESDAGAGPAKVSSDMCRRSIKWLLTAYGLFGFGYVITATFIIQMVRSSDFSLAVETWVWIVVGLTAMPSVWFWNNVANRLGNSNTFAIACLVEAVGVAASVLMVNLAGLILSALLLGGTFMGITALGLVEARLRSAGDPRHALAMMTAAFGLGQIIGPTLAGYLHDTSGSFLLPSLLASAALLAAACLVQIRNGAQQPAR